MKNVRFLGEVKFPKFSGVSCNMMPIIMGDPESIPEPFRPYAMMMSKCDINPAQMGMVGYLTVSETHVKGGSSQRRPGIHTEKHPGKSWGGGAWGGRRGGLYMASNLEGTTRVWDLNIEEPGHMGDCEHLRPTLGPGIVVHGNELVWMHDGVPHESVPLKGDKYRQFFRLVTNEVSMWYADHSTPNPLGIKPDCEIIYGSKFQ